MINKKIFFLLVFAFAYRLLFGLLLYGNPSDDIQTYLSGLKYYCTGEWPYFGPCVGGSETTFVSQMPGALSGFLIAAELKLFPLPESPFVFLAIQSMLAICFLAWYCKKRFPEFSLFWLLAYMLFLPWELYLTTNVNTASFIIFGSVIFFIGFFEAIKEFSLEVIPLKWCYAMMGFALFWNMQMHLSWVFFIPFVLMAFFLLLKRNRGDFLTGALFFILGAIPTAGFLVPTLIKYGFHHLTSGKGFAELFEPRNFHLWKTILQRYFSIANYDLTDFWGGIETTLQELIKTNPIFYLYFFWGTILKYAGKIQIFILILIWFFPDQKKPGWKEFKYLALFFYFFIWVSFWFTVKWPLTHIYSISYPVIMTYSLYSWSRFSKQKVLIKAAQVLIVLGIVFQTYFFIARSHNYIYQKRADLQAAIDQKNYHLFGERFGGAIY